MSTLSSRSIRKWIWAPRSSPYYILQVTGKSSYTKDVQLKIYLTPCFEGIDCDCPSSRRNCLYHWIRWVVGEFSLYLIAHTDLYWVFQNSELVDRVLAILGSVFRISSLDCWWRNGTLHTMLFTTRGSVDTFYCWLLTCFPPLFITSRRELVSAENWHWHWNLNLARPKMDQFPSNLFW